MVRMWSLATNQSQVVAKHEAPINFTFFVKEMNNMLVTGSWDRTVKFWDLRQPNPVHSQPVPERVYAMDVKYPLMVVGTAQRKIQVFPSFAHILRCTCLQQSIILMGKMASQLIHFKMFNNRSFQGLNTFIHP